ncbi:MAG: hypothetical protein DRP12_03750 [Candidatus Aenigmatarchaeota archaeon]|nr:MAG: hypothetical protein DRP12_03750 [Candidatus Aenigmarchaeota archaeon]
MNKVLDYIIHSSLFVGLVGIAMMFTVLLLLELPIVYELLLILFLVSFSAYNINRKTDIKEDKISHPRRVRFIQNYYRYLKVVCIICYILAFILGFLKNFLTGIFIFLPALFVILYSVKWIPSWFNFSRLKEIFLIKNCTVAFAWAFFVTFLPFLYFGVNVKFSAVFVFFFIFLKVLGNTITFDIRDIKGDTIAKIKTIPIVFGIRTTKKILTLINFLASLIIIVPAIFGILPIVSYFIAIVFIYTQLYIQQIEKSDIKFLTDVLADGEYLVIALLALLGMLVI